MSRFISCGTPSEECTGAKAIMNNGWRGALKAHSSSEDAFKCHANHLVKLGFVQHGPREFINPEGGAIRVLTKKSHFGSPLRGGKEDKGKGGKRLVPKRKASGAII